MPNYCENNLRVSGPTEQLDKFVQAVRKDDGTIDISALFPMPEVLKGTESPTPDSPEPHQNWTERLASGEMTQELYDELVANRKAHYEAGIKAKAETGCSDWYDWCIKNWGTKWGDFDHFQDIRYVDEHHIGYITAWGPFCDNFWVHVSKQFPELTFIITYDEPGMCFMGASKYANGEVLAESYINDVSEVLGELDWDDDDARDEWMDKKSDLLDSLLTETEVA